MVPTTGSWYLLLDLLLVLVPTTGPTTGSHGKFASLRRPSEANGKYSGAQMKIRCLQVGPSALF